jgi:hypothetical protein
MDVRISGVTKLYEPDIRPWRTCIHGPEGGVPSTLWADGIGKTTLLRLISTGNHALPKDRSRWGNTPQEDGAFDLAL